MGKTPASGTAAEVERPGSFTTTPPGSATIAPAPAGADTTSPSESGELPRRALSSGANAANTISVDHALPHDLSPWNMFMAADLVVKGVMVGLAAASFLVWTIWLAKLIQLWLARRRLGRDLATIAGYTSVEDAAQGLDSKHSLARGMLDVAARELNLAASPGRTAAAERIATRLGEIEARANRSVRGGLSFLATVGATAPFIGLFGTVWGIMNSFIGISKSQTTNLAVVAPGIAEALLATAIGLVAAIPAVILYNQLGHGIAAFKRLSRETKGEVGRIVSRQIERQSVHPQSVHTQSAQLQPAPRQSGRLKFAAE